MVLCRNGQYGPASCTAGRQCLSYAPHWGLRKTLSFWGWGERGLHGRASCTSGTSCSRGARQEGPLFAPESATSNLFLFSVEPLASCTRNVCCFIAIEIGHQQPLHSLINQFLTFIYLLRRFLPLPLLHCSDCLLHLPLYPTCQFMLVLVLINIRSLEGSQKAS